MSYLTVCLMLVLTLVMLSGYIYLRWSNRRLEKMAEKLTGPRPLPLIGNIFDLGINTVDFLKNGFYFCQKYDQLYRIWVGPKLYIVLLRPEDVEIILNNPKYHEKARMYHFMRPWLGTGLLTSNGDKWHRHRKIITPTFHFRILEQFLYSFNSKSDILLKRLEKKADGSSFNIFEYMTLYTLDTIAETAMGIDIRAQSDEKSQYVSCVKKMGDLIVKRALRVWLYPDTLFNLSPTGKAQRKALEVIHGKTNDIILEKKRNLNNKKIEDCPDKGDAGIGIKKRVAFLDLLLQKNVDGDCISDEYLREEVDTFMAEGHETSSSSLSFTLYLLSRHPDIQEKVYCEISAVMADEEAPTSLLISEMKYLDCIIKESLRLFPSVPVLGREIHEDIEISGNTVLPADSTLMIPIFALHRNPNTFPNPDVFDPDRFLCERENPFAYIPFSAGSRNCIGQRYAMLQMKIPLIKLIMKYKFLADESYEPILSAEMVLRSTNGIRLRMLPRHEEDTCT